MCTVCTYLLKSFEINMYPLLTIYLNTTHNFNSNRTLITILFVKLY